MAWMSREESSVRSEYLSDDENSSVTRMILSAQKSNLNHFLKLNSVIVVLQVLVHQHADHLDFCLELDFTPNCIAIFKPFHSYYRPIMETTFIDVPKTTFAQYVLTTEVACSNLEFSKLEPPQISQAHFFSVLF
nr:hypothetical protein Iba_chr08eCG8440 [Ipomoea batatas]